MLSHMRHKLKYASIGFAALALVACGSAEDRAKAYYESGSRYLEQKDYVKAAIEFRNALKLKEDYADAWLGMSKIEENEQNWSRVVGDLNKVLEINPKHLEALENLSKFLLLAGDFPNALKNANTLYALQPDNPDAMALKAAILMKLNERDAGLAEANKALKIKPNHSDATILVAADLIADKQFEGARTITDAALTANPKSLGLLLLRMRIAEIEKNVADQEKTIRAIVAANPDKEEFKDSLAVFLVKQKRTDEAEKVYRDAVAGPDDVARNKRLVGFLLDTRGAAAAREELQALSKSAKDPFPYDLQLAELDYVDGKKSASLDALRALALQQKISDNGIVARISLAEKLLANKEFVELEKTLADIIGNDAKNVSALKLRGAMNLEKGNAELALNDLREALNFDQNDPAIRLLLANAYERRASYDLAAKELADAFRVSKGNSDVGLTYAGFLLRRGSFDRAETVLTEIYTTSPRNRQVLSLLADLRMRKNDWKGAEALARIAKEQIGDADFADKIMGNVLANQGKFDESIAYLQRTAQATPTDIQPMFNLIRAYVSAGKLGEAESFAKSILEASPNSPNSHIINGAVQLAMQRIPEARASYETAVSKAPTDVQGYMALSEFHQSQQDLPSAVQVLQSALEKVGNKAEIQMALGGVFERSKKHEEAIAAYEAVVAAQPNSVIAVNNLVSLLTDFRDDQATLTRAAQMAIVLKDSPIPHFRETLGWSLVRQGDVKSGLPILEKTIGELENISAAQYHLGMAYSAEGAKSLAAKHLKIALNLEQNASDRERIIRALEILGPVTP